MKREIIVSIVETNTGLIRREYRKAFHFDFRYEKDRKELHAQLDYFIQLLRDGSFDTSLCLDIMCDVSHIEGRLPFIYE